MTRRRRIAVELTLLGPVLTHSSTAAEPGIDAPVARDGLRRVMLPYSLVKGKIVDAFRELRPENDPQVVRWLGVPSARGGHDPERGSLSFSDFHAVTPERHTPGHDGVIERIQIDPATGSTTGRMLAMLEAPYGYGEPVRFEGYVDFVADDDEARAIEGALAAAFDFVSSYGAMRTVGFGRKEEVKLRAAPPRETAAGAPAPGPLLPVRYTPDRPLCLVGRKHSGNHFESLKSIPGAVLKGAAAKLILDLNGSRRRVIDPANPESRFGTLCRHFERVRFAEARPIRVWQKGKEGEPQVKPVEPPLSVVAVPTKPESSYYDVARLAEAQLIAGLPPAFVPDWKGTDFGKVRGMFGWPGLKPHRRVRTQIDPKTWRTVKEVLFSYDLVLPETPDARFVWEGAIGLEGVPDADRATVRKELAELLAEGLPNIGKMRVVADIEWLPSPTLPPAVASERQPPTGEHILTLQTDCLMTNPKTLQTAPGDRLRTAYVDYWQEASGGALELVRFFARQTLHGGHLSRRANRAQYKPFLLTDRGSVFVLKPTGSGNVANCLAKWRSEGLADPEWVKTEYGTGDQPLWASCPFLQHVGFGEVAVDLACHHGERLE